MDWSKVREKLEERREESRTRLKENIQVYKDTWNKLSGRDKFIVISLITVGVLQILVGVILLCS
jgi:hypothetical protein